MKEAKAEITRLPAECSQYGDRLALTPGLVNPTFVDIIGSDKLLASPKIGLLCSIQCPGDIILKTLDLMQELRNTEVCVVSGFHSPLEQECLKVLLNGSCGLIVCPARSLIGMRIPAGYRPLLEAGRLLLISQLGENHKRKTRESAEERNRLVAAVSDVAVVPHATPGGRTESLCQEIAGQDKRLVTFESDHNSNLAAIGVLTLGPGTLSELLVTMTTSCTQTRRAIVTSAPVIQMGMGAEEGCRES
ncbi:MAG: hypothetical protein HYX78_09650 [Armatimonadetes bacterium]|nr:hypothetical protein [Armatimonadota bacterium]